MNSLNTYSNKCVLITGGTKGIGLGILKRFMEAGANVITCARNEPSPSTQEELGNAIFFKADIRDADQINNLIKYIEKEFGHLDVLINNAGGSPPSLAKDSSPNFNEKIIGLNLLAPLNLSIATYPLMVKMGGAIINISSVSAIRPNPYGAAYGAAKAGLNNLSETLAAEWGPDIRVNTLIAGPIVTEDTKAYYGDEEGIRKIGETLSMKRMGVPDDIAEACLFLASEKASWISGTNIKVHGGGENPAYLDVSTGEISKKE